MSAHCPAAVIVLAAGEGKRMRSAIPKPLHAIAGRSLLGHAIAAARELEPDRLAVVVRHGRDQVASHALELEPAAVIVDQDHIPGTGRAVQCALDALDALARDAAAAARPDLPPFRDPSATSGEVVVIPADAPLIDGATLAELLEAHRADANAVTILTAEVADPTGYGRVARAAGQVTGIVEERDATPAQRAIREVNSSMYVFDSGVLRDALARLGRDNAQGEVYLTDVVKLARADGGAARAIMAADAWVIEGVNDRVQLARLGAEFNRRTVEEAMAAGVTVVDPATTRIDVGVELAEDVVILPGTHLGAGCAVAAGAVIGPWTTLTGTRVGQGATLDRTVAVDAVVGPGAAVGPFTYLRPGTVLGADAKAGGFVEMKNAQLGAGAKVPHLSYVGDATVGEGTNVGAATIVANYDGVAKHQTRIGA
ncbi:MAG: NTP transferase domain-containing protein, partial [Bifidobacteriaceae bacterium]|nr:NTP transferase domain-containing protein [Bifidobacteriaceae bacterium]